MQELRVETVATYAVDSAVATVSPKAPGDNQDRARAVLAADGGAAVVCDGVGSYADSGLVAERCVDLACEHLSAADAHDGVLSCADAVAASLAADDELPVGATTLLAIGAGTDGCCALTMVGNGSIFALEPLSVRDGHAELIRAELAIPQCSMVGSQAALRSFLPAPSLPVEQSAVSLRARRGPRLLLACSDGISTAEERQIGRIPSTGAVWMHVPGALVEVVDALERAWGTYTSADDPVAALRAALEDGLDRALQAGALDDDATVAVVYVRPVEDARHAEDAEAGA